MVLSGLAFVLGRRSATVQVSRDVGFVWKIVDLCRSLYVSL